MWFNQASVALTALSGISALIINSTIRRQLMIYEVAFPAAICVGAVGTTFNHGARRFYIESALLEGNL